MKRIIKTIPTNVSAVPAGGITYDGLFDYIAEDNAPEDGAVYVAIDRPDDSDPKNVKPVTVVVDKSAQFFARHTFAGWPIVGKEVPVVAAEKGVVA